MRVGVHVLWGIALVALLCFAVLVYKTHSIAQAHTTPQLHHNLQILLWDREEDAWAHLGADSLVTTPNAVG